MLDTTTENQIVRHVFRGSLTIQDLSDAKLFVDWFIQDHQISGVLWDFRESLLTMSDDKYQAVSQAIVDNDSPTSHIKRAFLVSNDRHLERVETVLGSASLPWGWAVFLNEGAALDWLAS